MNNIDVELYINQVIKFFESNPQDLFKLIGNLDKEIFYDRIKKIAIQNFEENGDMVLSKQQMIDIVVVMYNEQKLELERLNIEKIFENSKFGKICLN